MASKHRKKKSAGEPAAEPSKAAAAPKKTGVEPATPAAAPAPPKPAAASYTPIPRLMWRRDWQFLAVAAGVALLAYLNALDNPFVYDDRYQILKNPTITDVSNIPRMFVQSVWQFMNQSAQEPVGAYYRPLFNIALIVNFQLFGVEPLGWHLVSVLLHVAVTAGVYVVARQWSLGSEAAIASALLFAVHPTHVESVAWASAIPDPLAGVLLVGALILYERYRIQGWRRGLVAASVGLAWLAMLTKETAIVFPVFVGFRELLDRVDGEQLTGRLRRAVVRAAPYGVAAVTYLGMRYAVLGFLSKTEPKAVGIPTGQVLLTIPSVLVHYAKLLFLPYPLAITYDVTFVASVSDPRFWGSVVVLAIIGAAALWVVRGSEVARRALVWTVLFLLPVLSLKAFNPDESLVHDRYLYLPTIGFCLLGGMGIDWIAARFADRRKAVFSWTTAGLAAFLLVLTVMQNATWSSDIAMAKHAVAHDPGRPFLYNYLGAISVENNRPADAETWYLKALELRPDFYDALSNLGDLYRTQNRPAEAEAAYLKAIEAGAPYYNTHFNLAAVYMPAGRYAEARASLERAIAIEPKAEAVY